MMENIRKVVNALPSSRIPAFLESQVAEGNITEAQKDDILAGVISI
jgi:hypothetical protein